MSNLMSIAAAGVQSGMARFDASAVQMVRAAQPGSHEDLPAAMAQVTTNSLAAKADLEVFKMADDTVGRLLDVKT